MHQIRKTPIFNLSADQLIQAFDQDWCRGYLIPAFLSALEENPRIGDDALATRFLEYSAANRIDGAYEERFDSIIDRGAYNDLDDFDYLQILLLNREDRRKG